MKESVFGRISVEELEKIVQNANEYVRVSENYLHEMLLKITINQFIELFIEYYLGDGGGDFKIIDMRRKLIELCLIVDKLVSSSDKKFPKDGVVDFINKIKIFEDDDIL